MKKTTIIPLYIGYIGFNFYTVLSVLVFIISASQIIEKNVRIATLSMSRNFVIISCFFFSWNLSHANNNYTIYFRSMKYVQMNFVYQNERTKEGVKLNNL